MNDTQRYRKSMKNKELWQLFFLSIITTLNGCSILSRSSVILDKKIFAIVLPRTQGNTNLTQQQHLLHSHPVLTYTEEKMFQTQATVKQN